MKELSVFVDESGEFGSSSKYYLVTLLFHDQSVDIAPIIAGHVQALKQSSLDDVQFHMTSLLRGHEYYASMELGDRKRHLARFLAFYRRLPVTTFTLSYTKSMFPNYKKMLLRMKRDLTVYLFDHLDYLQQFDRVKVYYDGGQHEVSEMLHAAIEYSLAREAIMFRDAAPSDYRLAQAADFVCGIELAALRYSSHESTQTDAIFFGGSSAFKKNWLKHVRKKAAK